MAELVSVKRIWDRAPKCSFTGLVRLNDRWYCVFRESGEIRNDLDQTNVGQGILRVITSKDGDAWESAAVFSISGRDLRDPKITITAGNELMVTSGAKFKDESGNRCQMVGWFSVDGENWRGPEHFDLKVDEVEPLWKNDHLWRVTWHGDAAYAIGQGERPDTRGLRLYRSEDGVEYELICKDMFPEGYPDDRNLEKYTPGEHSLVFLEDNSCHALVRRQDREAGIGGVGIFGTASPPYTSWEWTALNERMAAPHMIRLPDSRLVAAVRLYQGRRRMTAVCEVDRQTGTLDELLVMPSSDHTSYPGVVFYEGLLWVSYHSSHESRAYAEPNIYLARVRV